MCPTDTRAAHTPGCSLVLGPSVALLAVDVQQDFLRGSLRVPGGEALLPLLNRLAAAVAAAGGAVAASQDYHPPVSATPSMLLLRSGGPLSRPAIDGHPAAIRPRTLPPASLPAARTTCRLRAATQGASWAIPWRWKRAAAPGPSSCSRRTAWRARLELSWRVGAAADATGLLPMSLPLVRASS